MQHTSKFHARNVRRAAVSMMILSSLLVTGRATGQEAAPTDSDDGAGWFPDTFVTQPIAAARSGVDVGAGPLLVRRDPPAGRGDYRSEADASFGYRLPVYRFRSAGPNSPGVDVGIEAGVLSRFALGLGDEKNGLINSDFRIAFPIGFDVGRWEGSLAPTHVSSHIGDDFIVENSGIRPGASSRNGVELAVMYSLEPGLRLFGRGDYNWTAVAMETVGARFGLALDPPPTPERRWRPTGVVEFQVSDINSGPGVTGTLGMAMRTGTGDVRLGLTGHVGPSEMGQFRRFDEEYVGLYLTFVPDVVLRSSLPED
ncbi:MAG TPA: DUF1207 domain-containing protein [Gemmatimonadota bacterium]|nr:DUF1207 domain-containing protein [Gemmatimonadota bacterium]